VENGQIIMSESLGHYVQNRIDNTIDNLILLRDSVPCDCKISDIIQIAEQYEKESESVDITEEYSENRHTIAMCLMQYISKNVALDCKKQ
tara:strand:- start:9 stop:278 length:270 start_codon:yes stop_codon:yes gene_type:complete